MVSTRNQPPTIPVNPHDEVGFDFPENETLHFKLLLPTCLIQIPSGQSYGISAAVELDQKLLPCYFYTSSIG